MKFAAAMESDEEGLMQAVAAANLRDEKAAIVFIFRASLDEYVTSSRLGIRTLRITRDVPDSSRDAVSVGVAALEPKGNRFATID